MTGTVSLPTGAATAALQTTGNTALTTINTTLGSPFQAGGSIGNSSFGATQATPANLKTTAYTVDGSGNTIGSTGGALNVNISSGGTLAQGSTTSGQGGNLIMGAVTTAAPSYTTAQTDPLSLDTAGNLRINCITGCAANGSTDEGAFTAGTTGLSLGGGFYQTTATSNALTSGQAGVFQLTANRAIFSNLRNAAGTEVGTASTPLQVSVANTGANGTAILTTGTGGTFPVSQPTAASLNATVVNAGTFAVQDATNELNTSTIAGAVSSGLMKTNLTDVAGVALGAMANYGTSPGAVKVQGVNAYVTNTPSVIGSGVFEVSPTTSANTAANPFYDNLSVGGTVNSATNGIYSNLLQGNAVLSSTNPIFSELSDGTHVNTLKAASTSSVAADTSLVVQLSPNQPNLTSPLNVSIQSNAGVNLAQVAGSTTATSATGVQKVGIVGNAGLTVDAAPGAAPSNAVAIQGVASMTPVQVNCVTGCTVAAAITPLASTAAESSHVFKASAGSAYSIYVTTGATAGYLMIFNATSAPADGAVTPIDCVQAAAEATVGVSSAGAPPDAFSTGITAVFSTTGCFTKTASATAFFKGRVI